MKVLHLLQSSRFSGAENVVCQIIEMFKDDSIEMIYCSQEGMIRSSLQERNIKFVPMKKLCISEVKRVIKKENPDIIHAHDFRASIISSVVSGKIPVISHLHNNSPWMKSYCLYSFIYAASCFKYSKILTVSDSVFDEYVFGNKFKSKMQVIQNPINVKAIKERSNEYEYNNYYDVGFCGRLSLPKNPLLFIDIISELKKQFPNIRTVIIGDGELKEDVISRINYLKLNENIEMTGFLNNPYPVIKKCKVMCMPSKWEGFGLAAVEALCLNVPVICSNVGGLPGIVDDSCGRVCSSKEEYITEISECIQNNDYYICKSENAGQKSIKLDNYKSYFCKLKECYERG